MRRKLSPVLTGAATFGLGDVTVQSFDRKKENNLQNSCAVALLGAFTNGIVLPHWFTALDRSFGPSMRSRRVVFAKMIADQVIYAPFAVTLFVFVQAEICRLDSSQALTRSDLTNLWLSDCAGTPLRDFLFDRFWFDYA